MRESTFASDDDAESMKRLLRFEPLRCLTIFEATSWSVEFTVLVMTCMSFLVDIVIELEEDMNSLSLNSVKEDGVGGYLIAESNKYRDSGADEILFD